MVKQFTYFGGQVKMQLTSKENVCGKTQIAQKMKSCASVWCKHQHIYVIMYSYHLTHHLRLYHGLHISTKDFSTSGEGSIKHNKEMHSWQISKNNAVETQENLWWHFLHFIFMNTMCTGICSILRVNTLFCLWFASRKWLQMIGGLVSTNICFQMTKLSTESLQS